MISGLHSTRCHQLHQSKATKTASGQDDQMFGHIYNRKQAWSAVVGERCSEYGKLSFPQKLQIRVLRTSCTVGLFTDDAYRKLIWLQKKRKI